MFPVNLSFSRRGPKICDPIKCGILTSKVKSNAEKSLHNLEKLAARNTPESQAPPAQAPSSPYAPQAPKVHQAPQTPHAIQTAQAPLVTQAPVETTTPMKAAEPAGKTPGDAGGKEGDKSKPVSSMVLDEIKKIQKTTEKHRVGAGKGAGEMFR